MINAIYGFAVADAVGVPYEFRKRGTFKCKSMTEYGTWNQPIGTWSDDTSMTLATCYSLKKRKKIDCNDIMNNFVSWFDNDLFTANGNRFDIGGTTAQAIMNYKMTGDLSSCGLKDEFSNGNGSLMRILPLAFVDCTESDVHEVSSLTHGHEISKEACNIYVSIAKNLINGWKIKDCLKYVYPEPFKRLERIWELPESEIKSSGYVVDTLEAALWCVSTTDNYKDCILKAVNLGEDTDTVAALAGGLAGIIYGIDGIPKSWVKNLKNKELINLCLF